MKRIPSIIIITVGIFFFGILYLFKEMLRAVDRWVRDGEPKLGLVCDKCKGHMYITKNQDRKGNFIWKCNCKK